MADPQPPENPHDAEPGRFEQTLINRLAHEFLVEQRRARRWGIFFKGITALYVLLFIILVAGSGGQMNAAKLSSGRHTALVDVEGIIAPDSEASADQIVAGLRAAFEDDNTAAVIVRINSPGGSPVQAGYVNDEIQRLRAEHPEIPLYAVIGDLCASGGYYIAAAADKIYADKSSLVGSIGVIMAGFGFVEALQKLGVERRVHHAGENKSFMDPFAPVKPDEVEHVDKLLENVYQQFVDVVKKGRGSRLKDDPRIFSGLIWTGEQSVELGLVDGLGSAGYVAREVVGEEDIVDYTHRRGYLDQFAKQLGASIAERVMMWGNLKLGNTL